MQKTNKITFVRFGSIEKLNEHVVHKLIQAISDNSKANIILSGGNTPRPIYEGFSSLGIQSTECNFIPSDERRVSIDDNLSNEGMIKKHLKNYNPSQILSLHDPQIQNQLRKISFYDLSLLGMGQDGHFASIFPRMDNLEEALSSEDPLCMVNTGFPDVPRISLTLKEMLKSKTTLLLVADKKKLRMLEDALQFPNATPISKLIDSVQALEVCVLKKHKPY